MQTAEDIQPPLSDLLIDSTQLLASCAGDQDLLGKMVRSFDNHAEWQLTAVGAAIEKSDPQELVQAAHRLRGFVAPFSTHVSQAVGVLERMGLAGQLDGAISQHAAVSRLVFRLNASLKDTSVEKLRTTIPN